jgi:hypothetical protein
MGFLFFIMIFGPAGRKAAGFQKKQEFTGNLIVAVFTAKKNATGVELRPDEPGGSFSPEGVSIMTQVIAARIHSAADHQGLPNKNQAF